MTSKWVVIMYRTVHGEIPVKNFVDDLELKAQAKVRNTIHLLQEFGIALGLPHVKKLTGTELWELRILGADSIRVLYVTKTGKAFLLLHGFKKKKNKTPSKEIKTALNRLIEYRNRK